MDAEQRRVEAAWAASAAAHRARARQENLEAWVRHYSRQANVHASLCEENRRRAEELLETNGRSTG